MKLKKIASLMLAGIMAVSMLAGCKSGTTPNTDPTEPETPAASSFTDTVLGKTSEATRDKLAVSDDTKLDEAVAYVAENNLIDSYQSNLVSVTTGRFGQLLPDAQKIMSTKDYSWTYDPEIWNDFGTADASYAALYVVSGNVSDVWLANQMATKVDKWAGYMTKSDCNYSIRIVKAECDNDGDVKEFGSSIIVGVLVEVDNTTDNYQ